ncbi:MAG: cell wall-binding protein [Desulfitobacterium sp.]|nr:cell wall-binding protein [Desulfitobacterium sp.]
MSKQKGIIVFCIILSLLIMPMQVLAVGNPPAPSGLKATVISSSQINLSWNSVSAVTQYYIYRANQPSGTYTYIGASNSTTFIDSGLKANTPYYYKVQALNANGSSNYSSEVWAVTHSGSSGSGNTKQIIGERIAGNNRYETAVEIAKSGWSNSHYAIIASGENYPDALCASPLAAKNNAPILLTPAKNLHMETKKQLLALNVKEVYIIGGTGVVSNKVADEISDLGIRVSRLAGANRYETSLAVAKEIEHFDRAVVASGLSFQDVLSIAPIASKEGMPILMTPKDRISSELRKILHNNANTTYVLGDTGRISNTVYNQLPSPKRLTGANWYEMNTNIIESFAHALDVSTCYLATGNTYPDALAGSVLASLKGSPILLVGSPLNKASQDFLKGYAPDIQKVVAFGGTGVISKSLLDNISAEISKGADDIINLLVNNVTATPLSASQINLNWSAVAHATSYNVFRSNSYSGTYEKISTTVSPSYSDTFLSTGTTYYYKVQAVRGSETGPYSDIVYTTTLTASGVLNPPTNVRANMMNAKQVNLTWDTVSSAIFYSVYRSASPDGTYTGIATVNTPYYVDTSVTSGVTYYYKIQAIGASSTSTYSNIVQVQTLLDSNQLTIPTNVVATGLSPSQIHVKWDSVKNATYYNVHRSTSLHGTYDLVASVVTPFHIDTALASGTTYFYKIQAGNSVGVGNFSGPTHAMTQYSVSSIGTPSNVKATPLSTSQIFLNWDNVNNATYYNVYRASASNGTYSLVGTVNNPYFTDSNLHSKRTYFYRIQAGNNTTTGSQSNSVSGTTH